MTRASVEVSGLAEVLQCTCWGGSVHAVNMHSSSACITGGRTDNGPEGH